MPTADHMTKIIIPFRSQKMFFFAVFLISERDRIIDEKKKSQIIIFQSFVLTAIF